MATTGRQRGLHGQLEDQNISWELMRRRHAQDGRLTHDELLEGYRFNDVRNEENGGIARSLRRGLSIFTGSDGDRSPSYLRMAHEHHADDPVPA